jgi:hypothetical protein
LRSNRTDANAYTNCNCDTNSYANHNANDYTSADGHAESNTYTKDGPDAEGSTDATPTSIVRALPSNQSMKPTAPLRCEPDELATTPCLGLSLSR